MMPADEPIKIIGNESNNEYEIEPGTTRTSEPTPAPAKDTKAEEPAWEAPIPEPTGINNDLATNDGSIAETLDTAFHNKPGVAEGENPSGSDRADYYEARSQGKSDAKEELDILD